MTDPTDWRALCAIAVELWDADCGMESVLEQMRTALAQPEPQGPTGRPAIEPVPVAEGEVAELVRDLRYMADSCDISSGFEGWGPMLIRVAELLQRSQPIEPVPVSERLPGPEDCAPWPDEPDATPWCWAAKCVDGGWEWTQLAMLGLGSDTLGRIIAGGGWTHWAPHWALPVPGREP